MTQEWNQYFAPNNYAASVVGGWRGILYANLAIIQPKNSYNFFANTTFDYSLLDGGASRTWYLTWSAALGGSPAPAVKRSVHASLAARAGNLFANVEKLVPEGLEKVKKALNNILRV